MSWWKTKDERRYKGVTDALGHAKSAVHNTPLPCVVKPECVYVAPPLLICSHCVFRKPVSPWTWPPSQRGWSWGKHPVRRALSWDRWRCRGPTGPEISTERCPTARRDLPSVSYTDGYTAVIESGNLWSQKGKNCWVEGVELDTLCISDLFIYFYCNSLNCTLRIWQRPSTCS